MQLYVSENSTAYMRKRTPCLSSCRSFPRSHFSCAGYRTGRILSRSSATAVGKPKALEVFHKYGLFMKCVTISMPA